MDETQGAATEVAGVLRREGVSVDLVLEARKTRVNFKHASRVGASHAVMVAPAEWQEGKVSACCYIGRFPPRTENSTDASYSLDQRPQYPFLLCHGNKLAF